VTGFNEWNWNSGTAYGMGYDDVVADFNGDGRADIFFYGRGSQCNPACPIGVFMGLSTGSGFTEWTWSQPTTDWSGYFIQAADFNGDGKADHNDGNASDNSSNASDNNPSTDQNNLDNNNVDNNSSANLDNSLQDMSLRYTTNTSE
jgi:hypothetical protein